MPHHSYIRRSAIALAALWAGCTSREVPAQYPAEAPSSPAAAVAKPAALTHSLEGDPEGQQGDTGSAGAEAQPGQPAPGVHEGHHGQH